MPDDMPQPPGWRGEPARGERAPGRGERAPDRGERAPGRGEYNPDPGERLRERIAAARRSVEASLRDVLAELEHEEAALLGGEPEPADSSLEDRIEAAAQRAAEGAVGRLARRLDERMAHVDQALVLIAASERRMIALSDRIEEAGRSVARALDLAGQVVDWERRIGSAVRVEREVADRLVAAERRILGLAGPTAPARRDRRERRS